MKCEKCGNPAELSEVGRWPFACRRCVEKNFTTLYRLQAESIKHWEQTCTPRRIPAARQRFSESIERGLKALNL
jgi:hypothetical protein